MTDDTAAIPSNNQDPSPVLLLDARNETAYPKTPNRRAHHKRVVTPEAPPNLQHHGSLSFPYLPNISQESTLNPKKSDELESPSILQPSVSEEEIVDDSLHTTPLDDLNSVGLSTFDPQEFAGLSDENFNDMLNRILPPIIKKAAGGITTCHHETMEHAFLSLLQVATALTTDSDGPRQAPQEWPDLPLSDMSDSVEDLTNIVLQSEECNPFLLPTGGQEHRVRALAVGSYGNHDVLLGRGGESNHHPGNKEFHKEINAIFPVYARLKDRDKEMKTRIRNFIRDYKHCQGHRFMKDALADKMQANHPGNKEQAKKGKKLKIWVEASDKEALKKCSQAFRDEKPKFNKGRDAPLLTKTDQKPLKKSRSNVLHN